MRIRRRVDPGTAAASTRAPPVRDTDDAYDVVVAGSGAAGLTAAVTAALGGARVLVVDAAAELGGTSAISGGWLYVPGTRPGLAMGDDRVAIEAYLHALGGEHLDEATLGAFLDTVAEAVGFLERRTLLEFVYPETAPDYEMDQPGARTGGRAIHAAPLDARALGPHRMQLRPPLRELTVFGVMPQIGPELQHFVNANRSLRSFAFVVRRILTTWVERVRYGRPLALSNGNGLMARLVATAAEVGVEMRTRTRARQLIVTDEGVRGVELETPTGDRTVTAGRGVVLACGGFSHDEELRRSLFPDVGSYGRRASPVTQEHTGEAVRLTRDLGAQFRTDITQPTAWTPVTVFRGRRGLRLFPHLRTIGLPGIIAVTREGRRFTNESDSYHAFGQAMLAANAEHDDVRAYLVCDARTMHRYGLGYAKPFPMPRVGYRHSGYLLVGRTLQRLAERAGIDPAGLVATVREYNRHARSGEDPQFGRGRTAYNRARGDAGHQPNPSIALLEHGPFYATRLLLGDLGTYAGLDTDVDGAVLDAQRSPIPGLYAVGTAARSVFGGAYPGYGAVLGPSVVFGYRVGRRLSAVR